MKLQNMKSVRGIIEPFIGGILVLTVSVGVIYMISTQRRVQVRANSGEIAKDLVTQKLQVLLNESWVVIGTTTLNPKLNPVNNGTASHQDGTLYWQTGFWDGVPESFAATTATMGHARLLRIRVFSYTANQGERALAKSQNTIPTKNNTVSVIGYKYNDF